MILGPAAYITVSAIVLLNLLGGCQVRQTDSYVAAPGETGLQGRANDYLVAYVIDVGDGHAALMQTSNRKWLLINGGSNSFGAAEELRRCVESHVPDRVLEAVVITGAQPIRYNCVPYAVQHCTVKKVVLAGTATEYDQPTYVDGRDAQVDSGFRRWLKQTAEVVELATPAAKPGEIVTGTGSTNVWVQAEGAPEASAAHAQRLTVAVQHGSCSVVFLSGGQASTFPIWGEHPSAAIMAAEDISGALATLAQLQPGIIVLSGGRTLSGEWPTAERLQALQRTLYVSKTHDVIGGTSSAGTQGNHECKCALYATASNGVIVVSTDGQRIDVEHGISEGSR